MVIDSMKPNSIRDALIASAQSAEAYARRCRQAVAALTGEREADSPKKLGRPRGSRGVPRIAVVTHPSMGTFGPIYEFAATLPDGWFSPDLIEAAGSQTRAYNARSYWSRKGWIETDPSTGGYRFVAGIRMTAAAESSPQASAAEVGQ